MADAPIIQHYDAFKFSQNFLIDMHVSFFPLDVFELADRIYEYYGLTVLISKLSEYNARRLIRGKRKESIIDGKCIYDPEMKLYIIIYNDSKPENRIRFTIAHEFGHIVLGHLCETKNEVGRDGLPDTEYFEYENEANTFASNLLAPPILINADLGERSFNLQYVRSLFIISDDCARNRKIDYFAWLKLEPTTVERKLLNRCAHLRSIQRCLNCSTQFFLREAEYCTVCGSQQLTINRRKTHMKYSSIELDANSSALICPRCKNENTNGGEYCKICGLQIVNRCTDNNDMYASCRALADGDARFCHLCGSPTTFGRDNTLTDWEFEHNEPVFLQSPVTIDDDDGELPF